MTMKTHCLHLETLTLAVLCGAFALAGTADLAAGAKPASEWSKRGEMIALMVGYTIFSLWIIGQPIVEV